MTRRTRISQLFLRLFVTFLSFEAGAGLYETRVSRCGRPRPPRQSGTGIRPSPADRAKGSGSSSIPH